jgi:hypothetical protein
MMEAAITSETSENFYHTTLHYNPEDSHLHIHRRENLKYHLVHLVNPFIYDQFKQEHNNPWRLVKEQYQMTLITDLIPGYAAPEL